MSYLPLDFINSSEKPMEYFTTQKIMLQELGLVDENLTEDEFINFMCSKDYFDLRYTGKFAKFNQFLMYNLDGIVSATGCNPKDLLNGNLSPETEWMDLMLAGVVVEKWAKSKQVYKIDKHFANALIGTEKLQLVKNQLLHLPTNLFYVDLSDCLYLSPIHGAWCNVSIQGNYFNFYIMMLRYDLVFFSWNCEGYFNEAGILEVEKPIQPSKEFITYTPVYGEEKVVNMKVEVATLKKADIAMLCMQLLGYLTSKEPDIEENPITKSTYKPSKTIKNKFSEIQQRDVGIRYGKSIRIKMEEIKRKEKENNKENSEKFETKIIHRKPPKPHFRNAHWSHYWTGKGRTNYETRWIEPTFVGFNDNNYESDVIIHKIVN